MDRLAAQVPHESRTWRPRIDIRWLLPPLSPTRGSAAFNA
jgi:hypothetical protein